MNNSTLKLEIPAGKYCFNYGAGAAEDMVLCRCFSNDNGVPNCGAGLYNLSDDGEGIVKSPTCVALSKEDKDKPRFEHDCQYCIFLGRFNQYDLYYHPYYHSEDADGAETVIARYSNDGPDYTSGMELSYPFFTYPWSSKKMKQDHVPALFIARVLAEALGYREPDS